MADWRLDQKTEETPQGTDLSLLVRGTSVFKTTFQKIKEFIIGTTTMGTTATDVTGAVAEINNKVGTIDVENDGDIATQIEEITSSLNENTQKIEKNTTDINTLNSNIKKANIELKNGWTDAGGYISTVSKSGNVLTINMLINGGTLDEGTIVGQLPENFRPSSRKVIHGVDKSGKIVNFVIHTTGNILLDTTITYTSWVSINATISLGEEV